MHEKSIPRFFFILAVATITIHAFLMNGHYHLHQFLTVGTYLDPIVQKADPSLFNNSVYVQAAHRVSAKLWFFLDFYAYIYKHFDFELFAIAQAVTSLFFVLAGIVVFTRVLFNNTIAGFAAALLYTVQLENWTLGFPGPYLNFFHPGLPYANPLILWSMIFFFQRRFFTAAALAGIAWNFHPMSTLFLLFSYSIYFLFNQKEFNLRTSLSCLMAFTLLAAPTLIKAFNYLGSVPPPDQLWLKTIRLTAWYQCFPSSWPPQLIIRAGLFFLLFLTALISIPRSPMKRRILTFTSSVGLLCLLGTVFTDLYPIPLIIKLSFWRSTFIYLMLALPCIAYMLTNLCNQTIARRFVVIAFMVLLTGYLQCFKLYYFPFLLCFLILALYERPIAARFPSVRDRFPALFFSSLFFVLLYHVLFDQGSFRLVLFFGFTIVFLWLTTWTRRYYKKWPILQAWWVLPLVFIALFDFGVLLHKGGPAIYYQGRMQGETDPWADIQIFAREHSHKDDLFIIPPYLSSFGIYALRATLGDWAEGGNVLYTDNQFAKEVLPRMEAIGWKEVNGVYDGYNNLSTAQVLRTAKKYGARFVITEKPKIFDLKKLYENKKFILYEAAFHPMGMSMPDDFLDQGTGESRDE